MSTRKPSRLRRAITALVVAAIAAVGLVATPTIQREAHAETIPAYNTPTFAPDVFYVYVKKGEYLWYQFIGKQPDYVTDDHGNTVNMTSWQGGMASSYASRDTIFQVHYTPYIDRNNQYSDNQFFWNVQAVSHDDHTIYGRVWADKVFVGQRESFDWYNPPTPHPGSIGKISLIAVSPTGYQYIFYLKDYGGIQSLIAATSSGVNKVVGEGGQSYCEPTYKSYDDWAVRDGTGYDAYAPNGDTYGSWVTHYRDNYRCGGLYKLFFSAPNPDLPESIVPKPQRLTTPTVVLQDLGPGNGYKAILSHLDEFVSYTFSAAGGKINLQGDSIVTLNIHTTDEVVNWSLKANASNEMHLMISDVEMLGGLTIKTLNGPTAGDTTVYWDDSNLKSSCRYVENTRTPWEALAGVNSDTPSGVHGWNANNVNPRLHPECFVSDKATHGDGRIIDTWARSGETREWSGTFHAEKSGLTLTKTVTEKTYSDTDTELHWTYVATNTGNKPLSNVQIIDDTYDGAYQATDQGGVNNVNDVCSIVEPGKTCTWKNVTSTLMGDDFTEGKVITNTAKATGTTPSGFQVTSDPASDSSTYVPTKAAINIEKTVDKSEFHSGDKLTWTFTVTNTGDIGLHDVAVVEDSYNGHNPMSEVTCPGTKLAVGASMTCTATSDTDNDDIQQGDVTNTAHATGISDGGNRNVESDQSTAKSVGKVTPITVIPQLPITGGKGILTIAGIAFVAILAVAGLTVAYKRRSNKGNEN